MKADLIHPGILDLLSFLVIMALWVTRLTGWKIFNGSLNFMKFDPRQGHSPESSVYNVPPSRNFLALIKRTCAKFTSRFL